MKKFLKRDNYVLGAIVAMVLPVIIFILLYLVNKFIVEIFSLSKSLEDVNILLLSICLNLVAMRYYLVNLKYDKTGRGILFVTFFEGFAYFFLVMRLNWQGF